MAVPAARYLVCFDQSECDQSSDRQAQEATMLAPEPVEEEDPVERVQDAFSRGKEEGLAIARAAFDGDLAEQRRRFEKEMEVARTQWTDEVVERLVEQIPTAFREVEARIAASVARILRPALLAAVRDDVIASLTSNLPKLRSGDGSRMIAISGPRTMLEKLRQRMPELETAVEFRPGHGVEVKAIADQTVLDSQIQSWLSMLESGAE